jgi:hypothetical protein
MHRSMRLLLVPIACLAALAAAGGGGSATIDVQARSCERQGSFFNVQILGDRDAEYQFNFNAGRFGIPDRKAVVVVWGLGGPVSANGIAMYGWITNGQSRLGSFCSRAPAKGSDPKPTRLRPPERVKHGWAAGPRFACLQRGRVVVQARDIPGGKRLVVRMQPSGALIAVAEVGRTGGWLRASKTCDQR